jgi:uncharacterized delta-60 repeat protein
VGEVDLTPEHRLGAPRRLLGRVAAVLATTVSIVVLFGSGVADASPGNIVSSFGTGGSVFTSLGGGEEQSTTSGTVAVAPNGDIYQAGVTNEGSYDVAYVERFLPNGQPDTSFGVDGLVAPDLGLDSVFLSIGGSGLLMSPNVFVAIAANGDPVLFTDGALKSGGAAFVVAELNPDGSLNTGFDSTGYSTFTVGSGALYANGIAIEPDGDIVLSGTAANSSFDDELFAARMTSGGTLDGSFGTDGVVVPATSYTDSIGGPVVAQPNGDLVIAYGGVDAGSDVGDLGLIGLTPTGQPDTGFGDSGSAVATGASFYPLTPPGLTEAPDGSFAVASGTEDAGTPPITATVTRFSSSGQLETSFGTDGTAVLPSSLAANTLATGVLVQPDGKVIVTGTAGAGTVLEPFVARLNADGSADTTFATGGIGVNTLSGVTQAVPESDALTADGNLILGGVATSPSPTQVFMQEVNLDTAPTVSFSYAPSTVQAGTPVQFTATAAAATSYSIAQDSWDFGGGSFGAATGASVSHTFTTAGTYTVRVQATDSFGLSTISTQTITVAAAPVVTPAKAVAPQLKLVKLAVSGNKIKVTLLCQIAACKVNAALTTHKSKGKKAKLSASGKGKSVTVAASKLNLKVNEKHTFTLKLNKAGKQLLASFSRIPAKASFKLTDTTPAKTITHSVTIR